MISAVSQPKGSMCMACKHLQRACAHLPFATMPVLETIVRKSHAIKIVKCREFEPREKVRDTK